MKDYPISGKTIRGTAKGFGENYSPNELVISEDIDFNQNEWQCLSKENTIR